MSDGTVLPQNGVFKGEFPIAFGDITDGLTNTLLVGEKHVDVLLDVNVRADGSVVPLDCGMFDGHNIICNTRGAGPLFPLSSSLYGTTWTFGSWHPGICNFAFCDGTVRPIEVSIDPYVLGLLAQRNDGESVPDF